MAVGFVAVNLGIWVAGIGWPYYLLFAVQVGGILGVASLQQPHQVSNGAMLCGTGSAFGMYALMVSNDCLSFLARLLVLLFYASCGRIAQAVRLCTVQDQAG